MVLLILGGIIALGFEVYYVVDKWLNHEVTIVEQSESKNISDFTYVDKPFILF